jgi:hypothetical protein
MRIELFKASLALLLLLTACQTSSANGPSALEQWSVAVTACADGVLPGYSPDKRCTIGSNGDVPLNPIDISLTDIFENDNTTTTGRTDPTTGQSSLEGSLPKGFTPYVRRPEIATAPGIAGLLEAPDEATIVESKGNRIKIEIPYHLPVKPIDQEWG